MRNVRGNVVEGDDFFDRKLEQQLAWERLETDNLLLLTPRRIGKTSLMRQMVATAKEHGYQHAIEVSFADCADELGCMTAIIDKIAVFLPSSTNLLNAAKRHIGQISDISVSTEGISWSKAQLQNEQWRDVGKAITNTLNALQGRTLICADEVPLFILHKLLAKDEQKGRDRARDFLDWFRSLRQEQTTTGENNIRWILAGSIGLDTLAQRYAFVDSINDLSPLPIGAFSEQTARTFLQDLSRSNNVLLDQLTIDAILKRLDWPLPYYLQIVFGSLRDKQLLHQQEPSPAVVEQVFEELLSPAHDSYFAYWRQRLIDELGQPNANHAIALLSTVAQDPKGVKQTTLSHMLQSRLTDPDSSEKTFKFLIGALLRDGYIVTQPNANGEMVYRFQLSLLRDWWNRQ